MAEIILSMHASLHHAV